MKYLQYSIYLFLVLFSYFLFSCDHDDDAMELDENGLTKDITDLVPQEILDEIIANGLPIYGGGNPPNIEGSFFVSPLILLDSNRPDDSPGDLFSDTELNFAEQNNQNLAVMVDFISGDQVGTGIGSFIVGEGCQFSVFVEVLVTNLSGAEAQTVKVISGCLDENGISDLFTAIFMIDDNGDPNNEFIENGEGRVFHDEDGFSERL